MGSKGLGYKSFTLKHLELKRSPKINLYQFERAIALIFSSYPLSQNSYCKN